MARIPERGDRAAKERDRRRAPGGGARRDVQATRERTCIGRCPFHEDKTPSLVVTPAKNLWHCLGACQAGGTVIDWVMRAEGVSFRHAVELLLNDSLPLAAASGVTPPKHSTVRKLPAPIERNAEDAKLLAQVIEYYHETLLASPEALEYLQRRGIGSAGGDRDLPLGLRQSHAWLSAAGEDSRRGGGDPRTAAAHRDLARERARALQRLDRDPGVAPSR